MTKYPTWEHVNSSLIVSQERRDGTPDFYIERDRHRDKPGMFWWVKWRTSAHWSGPYATKQLAMRSVEENF